MNTKAQGFQGMKYLILLVVIVFGFGVAFVSIDHLAITAADKLTNNSQFNTSQSAVDVVDNSKNIGERLDYVLFMVIIALTLTMLVAGYFSGGHPIFTFIYFLGVVVLVAVSAGLSYGWGVLGSKSPSLASVIGNNFPITDLIISNFPIYVVIIGTLGMIAAFARPK